METAQLPTEIVVLAWSVVLLLAQIMIQAGASTSEIGLDWNAGPRDGGRKAEGRLAGRSERALRNLLETYPAFVALALALAVTGQAGQWGAAGAWLWLVARIVYLALYLAGTPYVRTAAWGAATVGLTIMLLSLVF